MALTEYTGDTDHVASLDDLPNDVGGLTAAQLKAVFDQFGTEFVAWFNATHLPEIQAKLLESLLTAQGDIVYASAANTPARLAKGTAGQQLTVNAGATAPEWQTRPLIKVGSFTRDISTASGTQAVTGVGFAPRVVIFLAMLPSVVGGMNLGFDTGASVFQLVDNGIIAADQYIQSAVNSILFQISGAAYYQGKITAMDADGFTITWTKTGAPTGTATIGYLAIG
jgi:hypothetical protein